MTSTPALWHLLGAYFHQDWFDEYANENRAVDAFIAESDDLAQELPGEIAWVLAAFSDEATLEEYLESQGCEYLPDRDLGYRGWLQQIADRVRAATGA